MTQADEESLQKYLETGQIEGKVEILPLEEVLKRYSGLFIPEEVKYEFEIIDPDPVTASDRYYIVRGKAVTEETFITEEFLKMIIADRSYVHVIKLTPEEILERYSDALTPEQIEGIKNHGK
jgi:hypothetical protein